MRFCPFCAQENTDEASECAHCGRRLPQLAARSTPAAGPPAAPAAPALRRPPVRPLPRPRAVPTAPALPEPQSSAPSPRAAASAPEATTEAPRARTGTLLGVATQVDPRRKMDETPEPATRVEGSPFDSPTALTAVDNPALGRFEDPEHTATAVRVPSQRRPTLDEDEQTAVAALPQDDGPTGVETALPTAPVSHTIPMPVTKKSSTPPWGERKADGKGAPPPAPLPPPPGGGAPPVVRADPPESRTNPATPLPPEERAPATFQTAPSDLPTSMRPLPPDEDDPALAELPPMPLPPGPGIVPSVRYIAPLVRAVWARMQAQKALRAKLHGDQRVLDETLHELGRAAWQESQRPSELGEELGRADEDEGRAREAEREVARLDMAMAAERERFAADEQRRKEDIAAREAEVARLVEDLAERRRAQKIEEKSFREVEARLRAAEKKATQLLAKATRAEATPPEKGGGPNAAANLRQQAEVVQREADGFRPEVEAAERRVRDLDGPIGELEQKLMTERGGLAGAQTELEAARKAHKESITGSEAERVRQIEVRAAAEKALRLRLISTGTILSLHRLDGPQHKEKFGPIYERLDQLKQIAAAGEQRINVLEAERRGYDRAALQRGLIVLGGAAGFLLILLIVVIVLVSR